MEKNRKIIEERPQNKNLTPGGPGRPKGRKNFATLFDEAIKRIAESKGIEPDEFEIQLVQQAITKGFNGDRSFYSDTMDRVHGKAPQKADIDITSGGETLQPLLVRFIGDEQ